MIESISAMWDRLIDNPLDEATRLVVADMLEESGDSESAELLRTGDDFIVESLIMIYLFKCRFSSEHVRNFLPERKVMFPLLPLKTENE